MATTDAITSPVADTLTSASVARRMGALAIDCVLSAAVAMLFTQPHPPRLASAAVFFVAYTFFVGFFAQTPGMRLCHLACVRQETNRPLGIPRAVLRTILLQLVVPAVVLDRHGRGWHDRAVGSIVVNARPQPSNSVSQR